MSAVDTERREALEAAAGGAAKRRYVRQMFSEIALSYDLLNHVLSLNIDRGWRRRAIDALAWERRSQGVYLDICAGTLDVSVELARRPQFRGTVIAADFAEPMLRAGRRKVGGAPVCPVVADALQLPFADGAADGALVAFGVRNFGDIDAGLGELVRVLAPGARLVVLDCSTPPLALVRRVYHVYFRRVLPVIGRLVSGHRTAYTYLPDSVAAFPGAPELARRLERAGLTNVGYRPLTFGVTAVHWGERAAASGMGGGSGTGRAA